ncbi:MAG: alpha/beta fold hydrolase [Methyloceanibacter sp.]
MTVAGKGPVVVFESGLGETRANWDKVAPALSRCFTVVTYARPGIGESGARQDPEAPVLEAEVADALLAALRARRLSGPYLPIGHSLGGLYVQAFARNHPADVAGIVLVDAASPLEPLGVFVSTAPPKHGTIEDAEEAGAAPTMGALQAGAPLPRVPFIVSAATSHADTPEREALWQEVQKKTAALSPHGKRIVMDSGHFVQTDKPHAVIDAVIDVASEAGWDVSGCRR